jgi:hypothetical protein
MMGKILINNFFLYAFLAMHMGNPLWFMQGDWNGIIAIFVGIPLFLIINAGALVLSIVPGVSAGFFVMGVVMMIMSLST